MDFKINVIFELNEKFNREEYKLLDLPGLYAVEMSAIDYLHNSFKFNGLISNVYKDQLMVDINRFANDMMQAKLWSDINIDPYFSDCRYIYDYSIDNLNSKKQSSFVFKASPLHKKSSFHYENSISKFFTYSYNDKFLEEKNGSVNNYIHRTISLLMDYLPMTDPNVIKKLPVYIINRLPDIHRTYH